LEENINMNKNIITYSGFTLIELIVAITIFSMIMISVLSIFILSSQMSSTIELTRVMQENVKNSFEDIAESVRKNDITDVTDIWVSCGGFSEWSGTKLCIWNDGNTQVEYYLANWDPVSSSWIGISDISMCSDYDEDKDSICRLVKNEVGFDAIPLTNNLVAFESLEFVLKNEDVPRVTIKATVRPSYRSWVSPQIIENNILYLQSTLSERTIITK